jgi:hypothetical protein
MSWTAPASLPLELLLQSDDRPRRMDDIDYVPNALLERNVTLKFVPQDQCHAAFWRDRTSIAGGVLRNKIETMAPEWAHPDIFLTGLYELR